MLKLDYLQNPLLDKDALNALIVDFNFSSIASKEETSKMDFFRKKLQDRFAKDFALPFSFECGAFLELFMNFDCIYYVPSLHYEIRRAIELISPFIKTIKIPLNKLDSAENLSFSQKSLFIMPFINEDIFSINPIPNLKKNTQNATLALDISYSCALGLEIPNADIFLLNGAPLGLPNKIALILSNKLYTSSLYHKGVSEAFCEVLEKRNKKAREREDAQKGDLNMRLYAKLRELLGDEISLFAQNFAPNTLPLRFRHINTRNLIQHLYLEDIYIQSSQECYLGFIKPSHILLESGFNMLTARELCAISFEDISDIDFVANKLAKSYEMIRLMEF